MTSESQLPAKRPVSASLAGPYGHPFHPILVTVPIGAWVASLAFDIASHVVDRPGFLTQVSDEASAGHRDRSGFEKRRSPRPA